MNWIIWAILSVMAYSVLGIFLYHPILSEFQERRPHSYDTEFTCGWLALCWPFTVVFGLIMIMASVVKIPGPTKAIRNRRERREKKLDEREARIKSIEHELGIFNDQ